MYFTIGDYKEFYSNLKEGNLLNKYDELAPYKNTLYQMIIHFVLFSNTIDTEKSCKYLEKIIRFVKMYDIDDTLLNDDLSSIIRMTIYSNDTETFFYTVYSFLKPDEMYRVSFDEYTICIYRFIFSHNPLWERIRNEEEFQKMYSNIKVDKLREILLHLANSDVESKMNMKNISSLYYTLAIIICDILLNNKDLSNIDDFLNHIDYYETKLLLNGYIIDLGASWTFSFISNKDAIKDFFHNIDNFMDYENKHKLIR